MQKIDAYRYEKQFSASQADQAALGIAEKCKFTNTPIDFITKCLSSEISAYEKKKSDNADAEAQIDMAFWAEWTFKATFVGIVFSFFGLFFLLISLRQTRVAISTDREVGHAQVRAYLAVKPLQTGDFAEGSYASVNFEMNNTGQSPAKNLSYAATVFMVPKPFPEGLENIFEDGPMPEEGATIPAGGTQFGKAKSQVQFTKEEIKMVFQDKSHQVGVAGIIAYRDVFGTPRTVKFCFKMAYTQTGVRPDGTSVHQFNWVLTPNHNNET